MGRKSKEGLGRALIKDRFGATRGKKKVDNNSMLHTTEINDGYEWGRLNLQSVTAESSLQEFLSTAQLAGTEFTAEKLNLNYVNTAPAQTVKIVGGQHPDVLLTVPRRPTWVPGITPSEQDIKERDAFLEWRKKLVNLQEKEAAALTPYERNLELWRQLWRTIEKADLLLILLDARNPLLFRCEDLEKAAMENSSQVILLLNKADLIGEVEREMWSDYFEKKGVRIAFFSAAPSSNSKNVNQATGDLNECQLESDEGYDESSGEDESSEDEPTKNDTLHKIEESNELSEENIETDQKPTDALKEEIITENVSRNIESEKLVEIREYEPNKNDTLQKIKESNELSEKIFETDQKPTDALKEEIITENVTKNIEIEKLTEIKISKPTNILEITEPIIHKKDTLSDTNICKSDKVESKLITAVVSKVIMSEDTHLNVENYPNTLSLDIENSVKEKCQIGEKNNIHIDGNPSELNKNVDGIEEKYEANDIKLKNEELLLNNGGTKTVNDTSLENEKELYKEDCNINDSGDHSKSSIKNSSNILPREKLISLLKSIPVDKWKNPSQLTVGLIGYPNVGKSSTVNTLMQTKKVSVSAMPGHTRHVQSLVLDDLLLLDCPGLVLPAYAVAPDLQLTAVLPIDQMTTYEAAVQRLIDLVGREEFKTRYGLLLPESDRLLPQHLLSAHAFNRGFMTATGRPDEARSARLLLKQASSGRLRWAVLPPGVERPQLQETTNESQTRKPTPLEARLVQGWRTAADEIDRNFFYNSKGGAHIKGTPAPGISGFGVPTASAATEKPWKQHNKHVNKNKKQKLRKAFWYLDQH